MDDFGDHMMDFLFEHDAEIITPELFLKALEHFPNQREQVHDYFMIWLWDQWLETNIPRPEPDEEEINQFVEKQMIKFRAMMKKNLQ